MFSKGTQKAKNTNLNSRFIPIPPRNLKPNKFYTIIHRMDDKKEDESGIYLDNEGGHPRFNIITKIVVRPSSEYVFYPISSSRKILSKFGFKIPQYNFLFPNRNSPYFNRVPNARSRRQSRKRVRRG